jgi:hypothetical protein
LGHLNEGLKYLWRYIESRMEGGCLTEKDYQVMNMFVQYLVKSNSSRRATMFLRKYIFKIPNAYVETRKKAFCLMFKTQEQTGEKTARIYREISRNNCELLTLRDFEHLLAKEGSNPFRRNLL